MGIRQTVRRNLRRLARTMLPLTGAIAAAIMVAGTASADTVAIPNGDHQFRNLNSNLCLGIAVTNVQAASFQDTCGGKWWDTWTTTLVGRGEYQLNNKIFKKCLGIQGQSTGEGVGTTMTPCAITPDQIWTATAVGNGFQLVNNHSGKCLAPGGGSTSPSAWEIQFTCSTSPVFLWALA